MESFNGRFNILRNLLTNDQYSKNNKELNEDDIFIDPNSSSIHLNYQLYDTDIGHLRYEKPQHDAIIENSKEICLSPRNSFMRENYKTEKKTDYLETGFHKIKRDRLSVKNIIVRKLHKIQNQTNCPLKKVFKSPYIEVPDFDSILSSKLISRQKQINRISVTQDLRRKYGNSLPQTNLLRKFIKYYNRAISVQPLNLNPLKSDVENSAISIPEGLDNFEIDGEISMEPESDDFYPVETFKTPEKQEVQKFDPRTLRSKLQPGILVAPNGYKSSVDDSKIMKNDSFTVSMPMNLSNKPIVYEFGSSQDVNFNPKTLEMLGLDKSQEVDMEENGNDEIFEYLNVTCRPKKPKYDRQFQLLQDSDSVSDVLRQVTPRRRLFQRFEEKPRPLSNISNAVLNDFSDLKLLQDTDFKIPAVPDIENINPTFNKTLSIEDEMPKGPNTPNVKFYPRCLN